MTWWIIQCQGAVAYYFMTNQGIYQRDKWPALLHRNKIAVKMWRLSEWKKYHMWRHVAVLCQNAYIPTYVYIYMSIHVYIYIHIYISEYVQYMEHLQSLTEQWDPPDLFPSRGFVLGKASRSIRGSGRVWGWPCGRRRCWRGHDMSRLDLQVWWAPDLLKGDLR
jgi:hypothetical protein